MSKKRENIHNLIKERFGSNRLPDEKFTKKGYWDSVEQDEDGNPQESRRANPDILPENASPWYSELAEEQEDQLEAINETFGDLTETQRKIIALAADGLSLAQIAKKIKWAKSSVHFILEEARKKIIAKHTGRKGLREH